MTNQAGHLFHEGRIAEAVAAASAGVKEDQADVGRRVLLAEMLLFGDDWARADAVLDAASAADPAAAIVVAEFRQLLRAAQARRQLVTDGRAPGFLGEPTQSQSCLLKAHAALRADDPEEAEAAAAAAEAARPNVSGVGDGVAFDGFRDLDDLLAGTLEVLTTTGKYFWVPVERIESMSFHKPQRARDLFWRRCSMVVRDGPEGDVYVPAIYDGGLPTDDTLRLGRGTEWTQMSPVRGRGQRVFLAGEAGTPIHEFAEIRFAA